MGKTLKKKMNLKKSALSIMIIITLSLSILPLNVYASTNGKIHVDMKVDRESITEGDKVNFKLEYKAMDGFGSIKPGDEISFKAPDWLKDYKFSFPKEHFKSVELRGGKVVAIFGDDVDKALGGYINISAIATNIPNKKVVTMEVYVNGEVVNRLELELKPMEEGDENSIPVIDREFLKSTSNIVSVDSEGNMVSEIYYPTLGKIKDYQIYINEKYSIMNQVKLSDKIPEGMELLLDSVKVYEVKGNRTRIDVTKNMNIKKDSKSLFIDFGTINTQYMVEYNTKITEEKDEYINRAELSKENGKISSSVKVISKKEKTEILNKYSYGTEQMVDENGQNVNVATKGDKISYCIDVNKNKVNLEKVKLEDFAPKGMKVIPNTIQIGRYDKENNFTWVTHELKDKIHEEENKITIDFGDIEDQYVVTYMMEIVGVEKKYENRAKVSYDNTSTEYIDKVNYQMNMGAINGYKSVDKKEIRNGDDQTVVYSINFESFGIFEKGYINIKDEIDKNVKILKVEAPSHFKVNIDHESNTVKVVSDEKEIGYGEELQVKIYTDFKDVENGTTIKNTAYINDRPTNPVETKKGYGFEFEKVDYKDENIKLKGAKFVLKDENKKIIKELISDENGLVKSEVEKPGTYYIQEVEAPEGYLLVDKERKFIIKEEDLGTKVKLPNIKNLKLKKSTETSEKIPDETTEDLPKEENKGEKADLVKDELSKAKKNEVKVEEDKNPKEVKPKVEKPEKPQEVKPNEENPQEEKSIMPKTGDKGIALYIIVLMISLVIFRKINRKV